MIESHLPILIPLAFLSFALIIPLSALIREEFSYWAAVLGSLLAAGLSWYGILEVAGPEPFRYFMAGWAPPIGIEFV